MLIKLIVIAAVALFFHFCEVEASYAGEKVSCIVGNIERDDPFYPKWETEGSVHSKNGDVRISLLLHNDDDVDKELYLLMEQPARKISYVCDTGVRVFSIISQKINSAKKTVSLVVNENLFHNSRKISYFFDNKGNLTNSIMIYGERPIAPGTSSD